jgi:hypothetical protein
MVAEARVGGVRMVPAIRARHYVVEEYRCRFNARAGLAAVSDEVGARDDYGGLVVIMWMCMIREWFRIQVRRLRWRSRAIKCSELVAIFMYATGVAREGELPLELTTPADVRAFCRAHPLDFEEIGAP